MSDANAKGMCDCHSKHVEAIETLKKDVDNIINKIDTLCPKGLFFWVVGFIITICAMSFGALFTLQSKTQANIATMSANIAQTQSDISRILNIIDKGDFVSKHDLDNYIKTIVHKELYFFVREQTSINKLNKRTTN